jgi:mannitol-1-/sugar-/sorbitol-6-phosphatase
MPTFHCSAILFDLDGVLIDSTASIARRWAKWAERQGLDPANVLEVIHGRRSVEVIQLVAPHLDVIAETIRIEQSVTDDADPAIPGAVELLRSLPEKAWCVVTSGTKSLAIARMKVAGLPLPKILVGADDVTKGKPDPEPYLKGAELLGFSAAECIVIEDALAGVRAAHAGKMDVIAMATTYTVDELKEADAVVKGLQQIRVTEAQGKLRVEV